MGCVPNCASGSATPVRTTITLSHPASGHWTKLLEIRRGQRLIPHYGRRFWPLGAPGSRQAHSHTSTDTTAKRHRSAGFRVSAACLSERGTSDDGRPRAPTGVRVRELHSRPRSHEELNTRPTQRRRSSGPV
jgi:hypothetical protein